MIISHRSLVCAFAMATSLASSTAFADSGSKETCVDSHSRGQDAKDQGKLSLARKLFVTCAQTSCPSLVQGDCARFADELMRIQPSLSFAARDSSGADLPDTSVYVDDILVATRLDDGKPHDVDPGKHSVKFFHAGKEQVVTIVVGTGEKGRTVAAKFVSARAPEASVTYAAPARGPSRPLGAKVLMGAGTALAVGGITLGVIGLSRMPGNCSITTHQCSAPPGDPSFDRAGKAMQLGNIGFLTAGLGVAAVVGGLAWYYKGGDEAKPAREARLVAPWLTETSAGLAVSGAL